MTIVRSPFGRIRRHVQGSEFRGRSSVAIVCDLCRVVVRGGPVRCFWFADAARRSADWPGHKQDGEQH
jgi:hypothetical protein